MVTTASAPGRILVIDDDARVRQLFDDCLTWLGHEVDAVASGTEALALLEARRYDLVLTDLIMPGMNGLEVAEAARALYPALPIIVTSGSASGKDMQRLQEQDVAFVSKPVDLRRLEEAIGLALSQRSGSALEASA